MNTSPSEDRYFGRIFPIDWMVIGYHAALYQQTFDILKIARKKHTRDEMDLLKFEMDVVNGQVRHWENFAIKELGIRVMQETIPFIEPNEFIKGIEKNFPINCLCPDCIPKVIGN